MSKDYYGQRKFTQKEKSKVDTILETFDETRIVFGPSNNNLSLIRGSSEFVPGSNKRPTMAKSNAKHKKGNVSPQPTYIPPTDFHFYRGFKKLRACVEAAPDCVWMAES